MATGGQSSSPQPQGPMTSLKDCPHCGSLCLGPRILPCGHLLCRRCLHQELLRRTAVCPRCGEAIHLHGDQDVTPSQLIPQMGTDPVMEQVVLQELERDGDIRCLICANKKAASVCLDCQEYYCEGCSAYHLKSRCAKDHVLRLLPQALQNTSSTVSTTPRPRSPSVLSTSSMDSICNIDDQQSRGMSRDKSTDVKEWEKWMKMEVGQLQQAYREHHEKDTELQNIETLVQQLRNKVNTHKQMLDTYQQYLSRLDVIQSADPGSYVVKTRGSDVSMDVKTASLKRRICDVRKDHDCPDINKLKMITGQLTQLLHSADSKEPKVIDINLLNLPTNPDTDAAFEESGSTAAASSIKSSTIPSAFFENGDRTVSDSGSSADMSMTVTDVSVAHSSKDSAESGVSSTVLADDINYHAPGYY